MPKLTKSQVLNPTMLSLQQLTQLKQELEKFFYKTGTNVAFHTAFKDNTSIAFKEKVIKTINRQILSLTQLDTIADFTRQNKAYPNSTKKNNSLEEKVTDNWLSFIDSFPGGSTALLAFLVWSGEQGGKSALRKLASDKVFSLNNKQLNDQLEERINFLVKALDETGIKWITTIIKEGLAQGMSNVGLVNYIREKALDIAKYRGEIITETELITAMNLVELETFKRNGITKIKWITAADERTCPICLENEAEGEIKLGERFPSGHTAVPAHILCRCLIMPIITKQVEVVWMGK